MDTRPPHAHSGRWTINQLSPERMPSNSSLRGMIQAPKECTRQSCHQDGTPDSWQGGEENMSLANKCKSLVSAFSCYPDPTIELHTLPSVEDNVTVMTLNVTQVTHLSQTRMLIAAAARYLWGYPSPQYLNAIMVATTQAIANTGVASIFLMYRIDVENKCIATRPLTVNFPNGKRLCQHMRVTYTSPIHLLFWWDILSWSLTIASLIGICPLCKAGCKVVFDNDKCNMMYNYKITLIGYKDPSTDLWTLYPYKGVYPPWTHRPATTRPLFRLCPTPLICGQWRPPGHIFCSIHALCAYLG